METKKCLIMCRTGMGSSMMLKIKVDKLIDKNGYPMDVTHDAFSGFAGQQNVDIIITMEMCIRDRQSPREALLLHPDPPLGLPGVGEGEEAVGLPGVGEGEEAVEIWEGEETVGIRE